MEDKLGAVLNNPQLMQQIMNMAQSLGQTAANPAPPKQEEVPPPSPSGSNIDPALIGKIMNFANQSNIDRNQKALLCALEPYLTAQRLQKLEKAMHAAKLASTATNLLQSGAIPFLSGR